MLQALTIHHLGPLEHAAMALRPRLNIVTGDNGLGKSFLLELAWWALTGTWVSGPASEIVLLFDEVENHLHPLWQRRIVPALLAAMAALPGSPRVQLLATTHAPLTLAGLEPCFDPAQDAIFHLMEGPASPGTVASLQELPWSPQGDAVNWLVSESFGLQQARSLEAERAIEAAEALMPWHSARPS